MHMPASWKSVTWTPKHRASRVNIVFILKSVHSLFCSSLYTLLPSISLTTHQGIFHEKPAKPAAVCWQQWRTGSLLWFLLWKKDMCWVHPCKWGSSKQETMTAVLVFAQVSVLCCKYHQLQSVAPPESFLHNRTILISCCPKQDWASTVSCAAEWWDCELQGRKKTSQVNFYVNCPNIWNWLLAGKTARSIITQTNPITFVLRAFLERHFNTSF